MVYLKNVTRIYDAGRQQINALSDISLQIKKGEFVVICGPSGSGKTTLLMTIAGMQRPTSGSVTIEEKNLYTMSAQNRANFRAETIGFVFQMFHLIPYLNVLENVLLAAREPTKNNATAEANQLLEQLGMAQRTFQKAFRLSAGEKQRTAVARALLNRPKIILADEPTGNLDCDNGIAVLRFLADFHSQGGTVILVTHGETAEQFADRIVYIQDGRLKK